MVTKVCQSTENKTLSNSILMCDLSINAKCCFSKSVKIKQSTWNDESIANGRHRLYNLLCEPPRPYPRPRPPRRDVRDDDASEAATSHRLASHRFIVALTLFRSVSLQHRSRALYFFARPLCVGAPEGSLNRYVDSLHMMACCRYRSLM